MIDGLIRWSLAAPRDRRGARRRLPGLGRLDGDPDSARRPAGPDGAHGDHPGRGAGHGSARDRVARHVSDRVGAQRRGRRAARAFGDGGRRGGRVGRVRLGAGHRAGAADRDREADARLRHAAAERRAAVPRAGLVDHGRGAVRRPRVGPALAAGAPDRRRDRRPPAPPRRARRVAGDRHRRRAEAVRGRARPGASGRAPGHARRRWKRR